MDGMPGAYRLEISEDGERWREMPLGYRQDGVVLSNADGVVTQSIGARRPSVTAPSPSTP